MKTLLVTGGTGGLGTAVVTALLPDYRCVVLYHGREGFDALRESTGEPENLDGVAVDLADEQSVIAAVREAALRHGDLYGVVHLAGGFTMGSVSETPLASWDRMLSLNVTSAFLVIREALGRMDRQDGRIVAISSEASLTREHGAAAYTIAKSAQNVLIELTAKELRGSGITANALLPSTLDTPASRAAMPDARRVPLDRVSDAIRFLLSEGGASVNGALIPLQA